MNDQFHSKHLKRRSIFRSKSTTKSTRKSQKEKRKNFEFHVDANTHPSELENIVSRLTILHQAAGSNPAKLQNVYDKLEATLLHTQVSIGNAPISDALSDQITSLILLKNLCRCQLHTLTIPSRKQSLPNLTAVTPLPRPIRAVTAPPDMLFGTHISIEAIDEKLVRISDYEALVQNDLEGLEITLLLYDQLSLILMELSQMVRLEGSTRNLFEDRIMVLNLKKSQCTHALAQLRELHHHTAGNHVPPPDADDAEVGALPSAAAMSVVASKSFDRIKTFNPLKLTLETSLEELDEWILALQTLSTNCNIDDTLILKQHIHQALMTMANFLDQIQGLSPGVKLFISQRDLEERIITLNVVSSLWNL